MSDPAHVVYLITLTNHSLTYTATTEEEVIDAVCEILRRARPLIGQINIEQRILYPASALTGETP